MAHPRIAMIQVSNINPLLRKRNGPTSHITGEYAEAVRKARLGEKKGLWKVISGIDGMEYQTTEMLPGESSKYLTKDRFALTHADVHGADAKERKNE